MSDSSRRPASNTGLRHTISADVPHFVLLVDRSERGRYALSKMLGSLPDYIRDPLKRKIQAFGSTPPQFTAFLGTQGFTGGTTMFAYNESELMDGVLPQLLHRLSSKTGLCAFIVALAQPLEGQVVDLLAEAQAAYDEQGRYVVPRRLSDLLAQAEHNTRPPDVAFHGGIPVSPIDLVFDNAPASAISDLTVRAIQAWEDAGDPEAARSCRSLPIEQLPNGTLVITAPLPLDKIETIDVPIHQWMYRSEQEQRIREQRSQADNPFTTPTGKAIDFLGIRVTGDREMTMATRLVAGLLAQRGVTQPSQADLEALPLQAHLQPDGSLVITAWFAATDVRQVRIPAEAWDPQPTFTDAGEEFADQILAPNAVAPFRMLMISRPVIENEATGMLRPLRERLEADPETGLSVAGKIVFLVDGYNEDPRDLQQIPEVLRFFRKLHNEWPTFPFYLMADAPLWRLYLSLVCPHSASVGGIPALSPDLVHIAIEVNEAGAALRETLDAIPALLARWGKSDSDPRVHERLSSMTVLVEQILDPSSFMHTPRPN